MNAKLVRFVWSLLIAFGLVLSLLIPGVWVKPAQAGGGGGEPQWLQFYGATGNATGSEYGSALAESADNTLVVIGAKNETVSGASTRGAAYAYRRQGGTSNLYHQLLASDGVAGDHFGVSVAASADGNTVLVGAYQADISGRSNQGAAYVFTWSGSAWSQQAKLYAQSNGAASQFFGVSVALSADGNTALIGANGYTYTKTSQGGAYVFTRSGTTWSQQIVTGPLTAFDAAQNDWLGAAVSLSADGNLALVSAPGKNSGQGAAYVYSRSGSSWSHQRELTAWDGAAGDDFGRAVSLSGDGSLALISADNAAVGVNAAQGAAYTFKRSGTSWSNGVKLVAADGAAGDWFGFSASLSVDGSRAIIGAPNATIPSPIYETRQGTAFAFYGPDFAKQQKLVPEHVFANTRVGASAAAGGDGAYLVFGAPGLTWASNNWGAFYTFTLYTAPWVETHRIENSAGVKNEHLGINLALSSAGDTALVGSNLMNKAYVYLRTLSGWSLQATLLPDDPNSVGFGMTVALSGDGNTALVGAMDTPVSGKINQGAVYRFTRTNDQWSAPVKITAPDGAANDEFGSAVALSADGSTAAIGAYGTGARKGSVYVMTRSGNTWSALTRYEAGDGQFNQYFGCDVALSTDGSTLLVGALHGTNGTKLTGAAYVFVRNTGVYSQQTKLAPATGYDNSNYGRAVALSGDGNTALIGAPYWDTGQVFGFAYIYTRSGSTWTKQHEAGAIDNTFVDLFGSDVALSADGNVAAIGGSRATAYGTLTQGATYVYRRSGGNWAPERKLFASDGLSADEAGDSVALSGDGHTLLFNAAYKDDGRGAVYFFNDILQYPAFIPVTMKN